MLLLLAIGSGVIWLVARTASFENRAGAGLELRAVSHAILDTWPGLVWLARHALLVLLRVFVAIPVDVSDKWSWAVARGQALVLATLALGLTSASSHAAAVTPGAASAVAIDVVHLVATGFWAGALPALALLLRLAARDPHPDALPCAVGATRRFSRAALISMLVLVVTGCASARAQIESIAALIGTPHGRLLVAKLTLLVPILAIAAVNRTRVLPTLAFPGVLRRLSRFVAIEGGLAAVMLALAAAMTLTTPGRHAEPVWPLPFRLSVESLLDAPTRRRAFFGSQLALLGVVVLAVALIARRGRRRVLVGAVALLLLGIGIGVPPLIVDAYPTTYRRPPLTYHVASIAGGMVVYRDQCAGCHAATGAGSETVGALRGPRTARRHAGELFWRVSHGGVGMPSFEGRLTEAQRWDVINFIRALGAAHAAERLGDQVEPDNAWLIPPDFTVAVGPLTPAALRDHRGRRLVLVVLYTLPGSRERLVELARSYGLLSVLGVEIIAVPMHATADPIGELGASPPILFPIVTDGAAEIIATYRMLAPGAHAELLIDRQGYIRAIWRGAPGAVQAQVEKLNAEKDVPPFPDDHVH
jgi:putative copper resistance protein D